VLASQPLRALRRSGGVLYASANTIPARARYPTVRPSANAIASASPPSTAATRKIVRVLSMFAAVGRFGSLIRSTSRSK